MQSRCLSESFLNCSLHLVEPPHPAFTFFLSRSCVAIRPKRVRLLEGYCCPPVAVGKAHVLRYRYVSSSLHSTIHGSTRPAKCGGACCRLLLTPQSKRMWLPTGSGMPRRNSFWRGLTATTASSSSPNLQYYGGGASKHHRHRQSMSSSQTGIPNSAWLANSKCHPPSSTCCLQGTPRSAAGAAIGRLT